MSFVMYVPGLQGDNQLKPANDPLPAGMIIHRPLNIPEGTYAGEVKKATESRGHGFLMATYQTVADKWPTLPQMGHKVAKQYLMATQDQPTGTQNVIIGSSVGAGVVIQALGSIRNALARRNRPGMNAIEASAGCLDMPLDPMPHVILLEGVYDPLGSIYSQVQMADKSIKDPEAAARLRALYKKISSGTANDNEYFPLPVEPNAVNKNPGHFHLQHRHVADPQAVRFWGRKEDRASFAQEIAPSLPSILLITSKDHVLSPPDLADTFNDVVGDRVDVEVWDRSELGTTPEAYMGKRTGEILGDLGL